MSSDLGVNLKSIENNSLNEAFNSPKFIGFTDPSEGLDVNFCGFSVEDLATGTPFKMSVISSSKLDDAADMSVCKRKRSSDESGQGSHKKIKVKKSRNLSEVNAGLQFALEDAADCFSLIDDTVECVSDEYVNSESNNSVSDDNREFNMGSSALLKRNAANDSGLSNCTDQSPQTNTISISQNDEQLNNSGLQFALDDVLSSWYESDSEKVENITAESVEQQEIQTVDSLELPEKLEFEPKKRGRKKRKYNYSMKKDSPVDRKKLDYIDLFQENCVQHYYEPHITEYEELQSVLTDVVIDWYITDKVKCDTSPLLSTEYDTSVPEYGTSEDILVNIQEPSCDQYVCRYLSSFSVFFNILSYDLIGSKSLPWLDVCLKCIPYLDFLCYYVILY